MEAQTDVDPLTAPVGDRFVIQQHHATALHHDVRLEMMNEHEPVLVSWAVPKGLPRQRGVRHLAIRTPDHSMEHLDNEIRIPDDEFGRGVVRIYDGGSYEVVGRSDDRITFRLDGGRLHGIWHLIYTGTSDGKEQWLTIMSEDLRSTPDPLPSPEPMMATAGGEVFDDPEWVFEPRWAGFRVMAFCDDGTRVMSGESERSSQFPELRDVHRHLISLDAVVDGVIVSFEGGLPSSRRLQQRLEATEGEVEDLARRTPAVLMVFDLLYVDGRSLVEERLDTRRDLLEDAVVRAPWLQLSPLTKGQGVALLEAARGQGLDGMIAKRKSSPYRPGTTTDWLAF